MWAFPAGVICAIRRGTWIDTAVTILANIGITVPIFWLGTMLIYLFSLQFHWLPVQGYTSPFTDLVKNIRQIIMPVFCLSHFPHRFHDQANALQHAGSDAAGLHPHGLVAKA